MQHSAKSSHSAGSAQKAKASIMLTPPPKQPPARSARSAGSAPMAKAQSSMTPKPPHKQQSAGSAPSAHPLRTYTVSCILQPPLMEVPKQKPTKGYKKAEPRHLPPAVPWPRPAISKGFGADGIWRPLYDELWRNVAVHQYDGKLWPTWGRGVTDLRGRSWCPTSGAPMTAGRLMRHAMSEATKMIQMVKCEHKIGMCRCPYERFRYYQESGSWNPWLMALLASTSTREAACIMEASLILHLETASVNIRRNYNWTISSDYGGEGRTIQGDEHRQHYVYVALKPASWTVEEWTAASAHLPAETTVEEFMAASAQLLAAEEASRDMGQDRSGPGPAVRWTRAARERSRLEVLDRQVIMMSDSSGFEEVPLGDDDTA